MDNSFFKLYEIINNNPNHDIFHVDTKYIMKCCDEFEKDYEKDYEKYLKEHNVNAYEKYIKKCYVKDTCENCKKEFYFGDLFSISNKLYCYNCADEYDM